MASEVVADVGALYPALTKPAPGVFRIGYIGTSAETKTTDKLSAILRKYASFTETAAKIDSVEIIALDSMPVRMNDPPSATEKKEDREEDEDAKFVAEFSIMPKYTKPNQAKTDQQRKEAKAWDDLETEVQQDFATRFTKQYLTNNRSFHLWLIDINDATDMMTNPPDPLWSYSWNPIRNIVEYALEQTSLKMLMVAADIKEAGPFTVQTPVYDRSLGTAVYNGLQIPTSIPDTWSHQKVTHPVDLKYVTGLLRWKHAFGKGIPMVLLATGSKEHIIATLDWMFSLHKPSVTNAIALGTNKQLPQTLEDLIADLSMSGKHCSSIKPKKWLLP